MNLPSVLRRAAREFGGRPALVTHQGWPVSYSDLDAAADHAASVLRSEHGVAAGDRVALLLPSGPEYVASYLGAARLGAVTVGVSTVLAPLERRALIEGCSPRVVLATPDTSPDATSGDCRVLTPAEGPESFGRFLGGPLRPSLPIDDPHEDPDRPVALVFTSGTTGRPKAAVFTERQLDAVRRLDLGPAAETFGGGGPMIASTQLAHVGFMTKLPWYLQTGSTHLLQSRWRADTTLDLIERHRVRVLGAIAPQIALLLRSPRRADVDLSSLELIIAGGAASPPALVSEARDAFAAGYSIRYSSTESGGCGLATEPWGDDAEIASIGRPRPGIEARVVGDDGADLPSGRTGELWLRSPSVFAGYWEDPEATARCLRGGWLRTGDLATRHPPEGNTPERFVLAGRLSDMFIRGGYNVFPAEVESVLAAHPSVAEVIVVPAGDPVMGEIGVAVVVPAHGHPPPDLTELRSVGAGRLAHYKLPEAIEIVERLPVTANHKIDRVAVGRLVRARRDTFSEAPSPTTQPAPAPAD